MAQTFLPIHECVGNTVLPIEPGCYVVTAITADGETPFCEAVCMGYGQTSIPPLLPPSPDLDCVNYYLVNRTFTTSDFTWDPYPGALGYNVYTAPVTDPTNFTLDRVNIPVSVLAIADQAVVVTAITLEGETPQCPAIVFSSNCSEIDEWLGRIAANGGITPPIEEQFAACDFISALKDWGLWDEIIAINYFSPNGRTTAETWLKQGPFSDTWQWYNPSTDAPVAPPGAQTFTIDGIYPAGYYSRFSVNPFIDLGWREGNCGITGYSSLPVSVGRGQFSVAGAIAGAKDPEGVLTGMASLHPFVPSPLALGGIDFAFGTMWADSFRWGSTRAYYPGTPSQMKTPPQQVAHQGCGYASLNRINAQDKNVFYAASDCPHQVVIKDGKNTGAGMGAVPVGTTTVFIDDAQHNRYYGVCSMLAFHNGFGEGESQAFYTCIQNFRMALGGGYV